MGADHQQRLGLRARPPAELAPYTATKNAVAGLTKALSLESRAHGISVGQIDVGNARPPMAARMEAGVPQADGSVPLAPLMDVADVARAAHNMAKLPLDAHVLQTTVVANSMPFVGRGRRWRRP